MPAILTKEERDAIDAAIAAGKLRRIAFGVSSDEPWGVIRDYRNAAKRTAAKRKRQSQAARKLKDSANA